MSKGSIFMIDHYAKSTPLKCYIIDSPHGILKASLVSMMPVCSLQWQMHMSTDSMSTELENTDSKYLSEHNRPEIHYYNVKS